MLNDYNREALAIEVDLNLPALRVIRLLERFNRTHRDETLNRYVFRNLTEARQLTESWMRNTKISAPEIHWKTWRHGNIWRNINGRKTLICGATKMRMFTLVQQRLGFMGPVLDTRIRMEQKVRSRPPLAG